MKLALFLFLISSGLWARPIVLLSYFNAFGKAPFNNSEKVALKLKERLANNQDLDLRLCPLQTVFEKSFIELDDCIRALPEEPAFVLSLGETGCDLKIETVARNADKSNGPDNDGNERNNTPIRPDGAKEIGLTYPIAEMYCTLAPNDRKLIVVSNNAGSFVCNNLAYLGAYTFEDQLKFGFIHVPANNCSNLDARTEAAVRNLSLMIPEALKHQSKRLPTRKKELEVIRSTVKDDKCLSEFYKRFKGTDEKGFWIFGAPR